MTLTPKLAFFTFVATFVYLVSISGSPSLAGAG
jgi:hypothetical protein